MIKHRKLFPTSSNNSTLPCPDICDSTCPYGCGDPYTGDVYSLPPQAPPPPPPLAQNSSSSSSKHGVHISPFVLVIVTLLSSCFVLVILYLLVVKFRSRRNLFRRWRHSQPQVTDEEFLDENHGPTGIDYPIWYINTVGLQPSVIESIAIFRYKKGESLIEGTECSVCLNEFQNDETLRLLPKCSHAFHIPCIDTWLRSHINCPVCRAGIVSSAAASIPVATNGMNSNNFRQIEDPQAENTDDGEIHDVNQAGEGGFRENRVDTGEVIEIQQADHDLQDVEMVKVNLIPKESSDSLGVEDLDNGMMNKEGVNYDEKPLRKCVSVGSLLDQNTTVCSPGSGDTSVPEDQIQDGISLNDLNGNPRTGDSLMTQLLRKKPVPMKRSVSYSGRSTVSFSRQHSTGNSALPWSTRENYLLRRTPLKDQLPE